MDTTTVLGLLLVITQNYGYVISVMTHQFYTNSSTGINLELTCSTGVQGTDSQFINPKGELIYFDCDPKTDYVKTINCDPSQGIFEISIFPASVERDSGIWYCYNEDLYNITITIPVASKLLLNQDEEDVSCMTENCISPGGRIEWQVECNGENCSPPLESTNCTENNTMVSIKSVLSTTDLLTEQDVTCSLHLANVAGQVNSESLTVYIPSDTLSGGAIAGIVIGVVAVVLLITVGVMFALRIGPFKRFATS